jgi:transposase
MVEQIERITNERVDDIPLLLATMKEMGLIELFNQELKQHGNWAGLSMGEVITVWLAYILSMGDHRKSHVEQWVAAHRHTLRSSLGVEGLEALDFTDDRLGLILAKLNDDEAWQRSERALNARLIRVYELAVEVVRVDTTTVSSYGAVSEEGLLQLGYSKDHRPDLGQVKIASATLDPLGLPLVTLPVSGEQADERLYLPVIAEARQSLGGKAGVLYVGDAKMDALAIRCDLVQHGEQYLMPLSQKQVDKATLLGYLDEWAAWPAEERQLEQVTSIDEQGQSHLVAEGFTVTVLQEPAASDEGQADAAPWCERRFIVRSPAYAQAQQEQLAKRLTETERALHRLVERRRGYRYPATVAEVEERVRQLLSAQGCQAYLTVAVTATTVSTTLRPYQQRPARVTNRTDFTLTITPHTENLAAAQRLCGWRAYATNAPPAALSLTTAVDVYRDAYLHEFGYSRLKGRPLALSPMYLQTEAQMTGLIRLLSLALRVLTLIEFVVRRRLAKEGTFLQGLYAGNPQRKTQTPRTETLLAAFKGITLTIIHTAAQPWLPLPPLTPTQNRILQLLGYSEELYSSLVPHFAKVPLISAN